MPQNKVGDYKIYQEGICSLVLETRYILELQYLAILKAKQSRYTPWWCLGGEEV
jgi:hypothetical protein